MGLLRDCETLNFAKVRFQLYPPHDPGVAEGDRGGSEDDVATGSWLKLTEADSPPPSFVATLRASEPGPRAAGAVMSSYDIMYYCEGMIKIVSVPRGAAGVCSNNNVMGVLFKCWDAKGGRRIDCFC